MAASLKQILENLKRLLGIPRVGSGRWYTAGNELGLVEETVAVPRSDAIFLQVFANELDCDIAPATVGVCLRIVAKGIEMREIVAD